MNLLLLLLAMFSPKHAEHAASLGKPMATTNKTALAAIVIRPKQTNWVMTMAWNLETDTNVTGYSAHWGRSGNLTNRVDVGNTNYATITFPIGGYTWVGVTSYDSATNESDLSNLIHWPPFQAVVFAGSNLQCRASLTGAWAPTNSPYSVTNPTGTMFFRSTNPGGPTFYRVMTQ